MLKKWGVKCFNLADSSNGYMLNVLPYTGHETLEDAMQLTVLRTPSGCSGCTPPNGTVL